MKIINYICAILLFSMCSCGYWINPRYVKMAKKTRLAYALPAINKAEDFYSKPSLTDPLLTYSVDVETTKLIISKSSKKYVLIVFFSYWCSACHEGMPGLKQFADNNKKDVDIIFVSSSDWLDTSKDKVFIDKFGFKNTPLLSIDLYKYGTEFMNWNRLGAFVGELLSMDTEKLNIGLPTYLLFTNTGDFLLEGKVPFNIREMEESIK